MSTKQPDYYAILNVAPGATAREITHAYRSLLRTHHPDTRKKADDGDTTKAADLQKLHAIMQAYVVLSDPAKRSAYDHSRRAGSSSAGSSGPSGSTGKPVKVRVHKTPATPAASQKDQQPLVFGPVHWEPLPGTNPGYPSPKARRRYL
ncbi:DnaJ-class molecular chaperone [Arthrobacter sp. 1088]|uniref:J domain-containing protein n=1 Tax=Arthrobacter sp. 1088 TaxID=2817768 RepID=UPI00285727FD|nr:DnaJ domain-containing protein [Arthrobacter sp. 1088]MDR6685815.1 DnaJ-class molecular chaperone [Arthrobacter sp. 1088]